MLLVSIDFCKKNHAHASTRNITKGKEEEKTIMTKVLLPCKSEYPFIFKVTRKNDDVINLFCELVTNHFVSFLSQ